jgi:hypothetical protein
MPRQEVANNKYLDRSMNEAQDKKKSRVPPMRGEKAVSKKKGREIQSHYVTSNSFDGGIMMGAKGILI